MCAVKYNLGMGYLFCLFKKICQSTLNIKFATKLFWWFSQNLLITQRDHFSYVVITSIYLSYFHDFVLIGCLGPPKIHFFVFVFVFVVVVVAAAAAVAAALAVVVAVAAAVVVAAAAVAVAVASFSCLRYRPIIQTG